MRVRAAVLREIGRPAPYGESRRSSSKKWELDPPAPARCWCASGPQDSVLDLSGSNGNRPRPVPMVLGQRGAGIVEAVAAE